MKDQIRQKIQIALLAAAALFIFCGFMRGEAEMVFHKAVNICMECIGLG